MYAATKNLTSPAGGAAAVHFCSTAAETAKDSDPTVGTAARRSPPYDFSWSLPHCPQAARAARKITAAVLARWHLSTDTTDAVLLVVSELVTNAVEHAQPPVTLHLHRDRTGTHVWTGVSDGGPAGGKGPWISSCADDEHGRGLEVVHALATAHGTQSHSAGNTHWAQLQTTTG
ncbi:ATP-binding protein [Streptomyces chartreusis]|uniref:ATP-binding protein n=1 Tax=Streptomyces chartreusis TaxID=1969 RepID=UPI00369746CC